MALFNKTTIKVPPSIRIIVDGENILGQPHQQVDWYYSELDEELVIRVANYRQAYARLEDAWYGRAE